MYFKMHGREDDETMVDSIIVLMTLLKLLSLSVTVFVGLKSSKCFNSKFKTLHGFTVIILVVVAARIIDSVACD